LLRPKMDFCWGAKGLERESLKTNNCGELRPGWDTKKVLEEVNGKITKGGKGR